jgi:hypothetical protein
MKRWRGYTRALAAVVGLSACGLGACGDDEANDHVMLLAAAEWNDAPGSVANLGYRVLADVGWIDRIGTCARIPEALRVTVNDIEATQTWPGGACPFDALFEAAPFTTPDPVTVRLFQDDRLRAEATFEGMFWGTQARLISPEGGQVRPGDEVVVSIPSENAPPQLMFAKWYWLGTAPSVPPFYTTSSAALSADNSTFTATVPDMNGLTGPVALMFTYGGADLIVASACTGFSDCVMHARYALGPIALDVRAP